MIWLRKEGSYLGILPVYFTLTFSLLQLLMQTTLDVTPRMSQLDLSRTKMARVWNLGGSHHRFVRKRSLVFA